MNEFRIFTRSNIQACAAFLIDDDLISSAFRWGREASPVTLLEPDEPLYAWRERMLDLFDGLGRTVAERR